ncbi:MAG: VWA domain-containing protein [Acidobacteriota bacterium]|nr:VWA domain-containing protein [Acidobacteriota bacterium]
MTLAAVVALAQMSSSLAPALAQGATPDFRTGAERKMIHIVPPERGHRELFSGRVEVQTLPIHPLIRTVDFFLDETPVKRIGKPPFQAYIKLANPPREQTLEVRGYDALGNILGADRMILNEPDVPFGVRIATMRRVQANGYDAVRIEAEVSVPRSATLERVAFYRGERLAEAVRRFGDDAAPRVPRTIPVDALMEYGSSDDFVRVVATLKGGRELEDAQLLQGAEYQDEIDIQLIQLQLLVSDRDGSPVRGLRPEDFEIREDRRKRPVHDLHTALDVPLVLGLAIDLSDSMVPIWHQVREVSARFVNAALSPGDRAFVVGFSGEVRLTQPLTGDKRRLASQVRLLVPRIGTALNDGILFSLLQYGREPGRRALVVITDGVDRHSRSTPKQSADFAERLGLPIYFIELDRPATRTGSREGGQLNIPAGQINIQIRIPRESTRRKHRKRLEKISSQTGGRLFYVDLTADDPPWPQQVQGVFKQIEEDLRHQHVLTYYTDRPPGAAVAPEVRIIRRGLSLRSAVPLEAIE